MIAGDVWSLLGKRRQEWGPTIDDSPGREGGPASPPPQHRMAKGDAEQGRRDQSKGHPRRG